MKATGIVRRIDDLGRVVIPKEIRRTLHIRVGEPLEIYVSGDGEVIFRKYSPLGELSNFAVQYAEVLARATGGAVLVSDRDHVITVSGASKKEFVDQRISQAYEQAMENRRVLSVRGRGPRPSLCRGADVGHGAGAHPGAGRRDRLGGAAGGRTGGAAAR